MINRHARDKAADSLRDLLDGFISNYEYEKRYPETEDDPAVRAVFMVVWYYYSDMREHKLTGKHAPGDEARTLLERCALFLRSDLEFQWPVPEPSFRYGIMRLLGLGRLLEGRVRQEYAAGDEEVWPFFKKAEYVKALHRPESSAS